MYVGEPTFCLKVEDLDRSRGFYQSLGMEASNEVPGKRVLLRRGGFSLLLATSLEKDVVNFRGVDAFAILAARWIGPVDLCRLWGGFMARHAERSLHARRQLAVANF